MCQNMLYNGSPGIYSIFHRMRIAETLKSVNQIDLSEGSRDAHFYYTQTRLQRPRCFRQT